ncbi:MAG: hypothetical protein WC789_02995 [Lentisphaeria bacterium]|jgi:type II secretory pathway pseudopilin PulG
MNRRRPPSFQSPVSSSPLRATARRFTLIELLAAMAVLVILMFALFSFFGTAQKLWSHTETNTRIYENARTALDIITRDLQATIPNGEDAGKIPFWIGKRETIATGDRDRLAFVAATEAFNGTESRAVEVLYNYDATDFEFKRALTGDDATTANWDFYAKHHPATWYSTIGGTGRQKVIGGVENIVFQCVQGGAVVNPDTAPSATYDLDNPPDIVTVSLTVFDEKLAPVWKDLPAAKQAEQRRTFTKIIFLGGRN